MTDFLAEDYRHTGDLLRKYAFGKSEDADLFRAVCSNNLNIILAALAHAEATTLVLEPAAPWLSAAMESDEEEAR